MLRILVILGALILSYLCVVLAASIGQLADTADRIYLGLGQSVFWILTTIFLFFVASPFTLYFRLPKALIPPAETSGPKHDEYIIQLRSRLAKNPRLKEVPLERTEDVISAITVLSKHADELIKQTANTVFVGTAVMQNGRLDGFITLLAQAKMVWEIAMLYNQRPSPRQMLYLYSNVAATAFLAQSIDDIDFSELVTPIVVSIIPSLKGAVPGLQGISHLLVNSLSSGAANSMLTLRVGFVTRQYCEAISRPSQQLVRKNASVAALAMIGQITKDNSIQIVKKSWEAVAGLASDAIGATVQVVKTTAGKVSDTAVAGAKNVGNAFGSTVDKVSDTTVAGAKSVGNALESTAQGVKHGALLAATSAGTGVKVLGGVLDSSVQGMKNGAEKASDSALTGVKAIGGMFDSTVQGAKAGAVKITSRSKVDS